MRENVITVCNSLWQIPKIDSTKVLDFQVLYEEDKNKHRLFSKLGGKILFPIARVLLTIDQL